MTFVAVMGRATHMILNLFIDNYTIESYNNALVTAGLDLRVSGGGGNGGGDRAFVAVRGRALPLLPLLERIAAKFGISLKPSEEAGPKLPPSEPESDEEEEEEDGRKRVLGPARPPAAMLSASGALDDEAWWQKSDAERLAELADTGPTEPVREEWMTALPTNRAGLGQVAPDQARSFTRTGLTVIGDTSGWTDTPADKEKRTAEIKARRESEAVAKAAEAQAIRSGKGIFSGLSVGHPVRSNNAPGISLAGPDPTSTPWRPFDRDKDLDPRRGDPNGLKRTLNDNVMGTLSSRFGDKGTHETTFM
ncbi:hypothetical protein T492DRAFT_1015291 [Pavlovales sp. CCMP2436]|nr:hypothetical protein T492DRAFT_1015291 [Pavlovales sp. CCMP2436]